MKTTGAEKKVKLGLFRGTSPSLINQFSDWLGRDVQYAVDYSTRATWPRSPIPATRWAPGRQRLPDGLRRGHAAHPGRLGDAGGGRRRRLRPLLQDAGPEPGGTRAGRCDHPAGLGVQCQQGELVADRGRSEGLRGYWRNIVTAMRSVAGAEKLQFDWNVNNGGETYDSTIFYPGNKYVDYVGVDVYDISWDADAIPTRPAAPVTASAPIRRRPGPTSSGRATGWLSGPTSPGSRRNLCRFRSGGCGTARRPTGTAGWTIRTSSSRCTTSSTIRATTWPISLLRREPGRQGQTPAERNAEGAGPVPEGLRALTGIHPVGRSRKRPAPHVK